MKSAAIVFAFVGAIAAASLGFSAVSFAQGNDRRGGRDEQQQDQYQQQGPHQMQQRDHQRYEPGVNRGMDRGTNRWADRRFESRRDFRPDFRDGSRNDRHDFYNARGPDFRRGGYIPREFYAHQYVVNDYRSYRLSAPPRGQEWVQVGSDFVLIAIATGLIAHIVLNN